MGCAFLASWVRTSVYPLAMTSGRPVDLLIWKRITIKVEERFRGFDYEKRIYSPDDHCCHNAPFPRGFSSIRHFRTASDHPANHSKWPVGTGCVHPKMGWSRVIVNGQSVQGAYITEN